jgi:hypothetical protein
MTTMSMENALFQFAFTGVFSLNHPSEPMPPAPAMSLEADLQSRMRRTKGYAAELAAILRARPTRPQ